MENTPDLVVFYLPLPQRLKIILVLLNVGFDWAIDARIRLNRLPFPPKRIRELNEQGQLVVHRQLQLHTCGDYQYLQLSTDTAVPPLQMTVLILEG